MLLALLALALPLRFKTNVLGGSSRDGSIGASLKAGDVRRVFEAGYFAAAKGKQRVLIIREKGSKMPADLGGDIYAALDDPSDIKPIEDDIRKFVEHRL